MFGSMVLICWAITMAFLAKNYYLYKTPAPEYTSEGLFASVSTVPGWQDIEEYMLIVQTDKDSGARNIIGAAATEIRRIADPVTTATYEATLNLEGKLSPLLPRAIVKVSSLLDRNVSLTNFHGMATVGPVSFTATGALANNLLYVITHKPNGISYTKRELKDGISMAEALRPALGTQMEIKPGNQMSAPILDPLSGRYRGTLTIRIEKKEPVIIEGREIKAFRVVSSLGDIRTTMWVDEDGQTLRRQLIGGLAMERTTREKALAQAPSLQETLEIPEVDPADFKDVPLSREGEVKNGENLPGMSMLEALLK